MDEIKLVKPTKEYEKQMIEYKEDINGDFIVFKAEEKD